MIPFYKQRIERDNVYFIQEEPCKWEGFIKGFSRNFIGELKKSNRLTFSVNGVHSFAGTQYICKFFNSNQLAILHPLDSIEDVAAVIDVSIKLGIKYNNKQN